METLPREGVRVENGRRVYRDSNGKPYRVLGEVILTVHEEVDVRQSAGQTASWYEIITIQPGQTMALLKEPHLSYWVPTAYVNVEGVVKERHTPSGFGGYYGYGNPGAKDVGKRGWALINVTVENDKASVPPIYTEVMSATFVPESLIEATPLSIEPELDAAALEKAEMDHFEWDAATCTMCDGFGHGFLDGGPCPLEECR